jgi:uncharacterized membrane protein
VQPLHPLHVVLLVGTVPVFLGALFSDMAYSMTYEIQWKNFASWSIVWGLVLGGLALLWALLALLRADRRRGTRRLFYTGVLFASWVLGLVNAFVHAGDAWASMPAGLVLSAIVGLLAIAATWLGLADRDRVRAR